MQRTVRLILFAFILGVFAANGSFADDAADVQAAYGAYRDAVTAQDGAAAVKLLDQATLDYFGAIQEAALYSSAADVRAQPLVDQLMILIMRKQVPVEQLQGFETRQLVAHAVDNGWIAKEAVQAIRIGDVTVDGNTASGRDAREPNIELHFSKEGGSWKINLAALLAPMQGVDRSRLRRPWHQHRGIRRDDGRRRCRWERRSVDLGTAGPSLSVAPQPRMAVEVQTMRLYVRCLIACLSAGLLLNAGEAPRAQEQAKASAKPKTERSAEQAPQGTRSFEGHRYLFSESIEELSWTAAKQQCEAWGGHLAVVTSKAEADFVTELCDGKYAYLGASDAKEEGRWNWVDGTPWEFTFWSDGQPNNYGDSEDYLATYDDGEWVDVDHSGAGFWMPTGFVCEWAG